MVELHVTGMTCDSCSAHVWLVGILPVTLYPFLGGKVWCRYWCPLAKLMHLQSKLFVKLKWSKFKIVANNKCIGCKICVTVCPMGTLGFGRQAEVISAGRLISRLRGERWF